jgi:flagellar basal body rod protein FlgB
MIILVLGSLVWSEVNSIIYDDTMVRLEGEMKACVKKQSIYAHNIANAEVEGYQPIRFADELREIKSRPGFTEDKVIVAEEMGKMTKNKLRHQAYMRLYNMKLESLKQVINQGK